MLKLKPLKPNNINTEIGNSETQGKPIFKGPGRSNQRTICK